MVAGADKEKAGSGNWKTASIVGLSSVALVAGLGLAHNAVVNNGENTVQVDPQEAAKAQERLSKIRVAITHAATMSLEEYRRLRGDAGAIKWESTFTSKGPFGIEFRRVEQGQRLRAVNYSAPDLTKLKAEELTIGVNAVDQGNLLYFSDATTITNFAELGKSDSDTLSLGVQVAGEKADNFDLTTDNVRQALVAEPLKLHVSRQKTSGYPSIGDLGSSSQDNRNYTVDSYGTIFVDTDKLDGQAADEATKEILAIVADFESKVSD